MSNYFRSRFAQQLSRFEAHLRGRELSQNTITTYLTAMRQFFQLFSDASKENGIKYKEMLQKRKAKPSTINMKINAYNAYCKMLGDEKSQVKTVSARYSTTVSNVISRSQYHKLLKELKKDGNSSWYFSIKLLAVTGARVSEAVRITKRDFDNGFAEVWSKGKMRRIYIPMRFQEEAAEFYQNIRDSDPLIRNKCGKAISTRGVAYMLQSFAKRYGIDKRVMHPHAFRHLFAIEFLRKTSNLPLLSDIMGHSSVSTTAIYTRLTQEEQERIINKAIIW